MQNLIIHGFENVIWLIVWAVFLGCMSLFILMRNTRSNFVDDDLLTEVYGKNSWWYTLYIFLLLLITGLFFVVLAWPYNQQEIEKISKNWIDIEIVFDISYSMLWQDLLPNRLTAATTMFSNFISELESDRVWLILFSWKPFHSIPLTYDYRFLDEFIQKISVDTINQQYEFLQWSATGDAVLLAVDILIKDKQEREKIIILVTDGEADGWINPEIALKYAISENIKIYTIWIGTPEGIDLEIYVPDKQIFQKKRVVLDEWFLKRLSLQTWWKYFRADGEDVLRQIIETIGKLEKSELETEIISFYSSKKKVFLYILLLFFICEWYIIFFKKVYL